MRIIVKPFLLLLLIAFGRSAFAQEKTNPVIYADFFAGLGASTSIVGNLTADVNYGHGNSLLTGRFGATTWIDLDPKDKDLFEAGLLYGRRSVKGGQAFSFSAGISANRYRFTYGNTGKPAYAFTELGFPFEVGIKWFKSEKKRFRVYGIPLTKPTSLGWSIGFKLSGNFSRYSYGAIGLDIGLGWHKPY